MTAALTLVPDPTPEPAPDATYWLERARFDAATYLAEDVYYDGGVRLSSMGWSLPPEMSVLQTVVGWPSLAVDSHAVRVQEDGFRFRGQAKSSEAVADLWHASRARAEAPLMYAEAMVHRRAYWTIGGRPGSDVPIVRAESRLDLWADVDPRTGDVLGAVRPFREDDQDHVAIMLPNFTSYQRKDHGRWVEYDRITHDLGDVPVVPVVHGATVRRRDGASLMQRVVSLTDACARTLTNLGGAQELLSVPQRYISGVKSAEITKADGSPVSPAELYLGRFLAFSNPEVKLGQLSAADLRNFTEVVNLYSKLTSSVTGLPPDYLGYSDANPTAADAIVASRERMVTNVESIHQPFGDANERLATLLLRWTGEDDDPDPLECIWRDPATPTFAARADAAVKLYSAGLLPREAAWDVLGINPDEQRRWAALLSEDPLERYVGAQLGGMRDGSADNGAPAGTGQDLGDAVPGGPRGTNGSDRPGA